jgi:hypothetical protein
MMQDWSDWEVVKPKKSKFNSEKFNPDEWEVVKQQPYKDESFIQKLPRNVAIGAANLAHSTLSAPHDITQGLEQSTQEFGNAINSGLLEKYGIKKPKLDYDIASQISKPAPHDFAQEFGQNGGGTFADKAIQKVVEYAPELLVGGSALRKIVPHLTRKGASKKLNLLQNKMNALSELEGNEMVNLYHGKSPELANSILENGLTSPKYDPDYALLTNKPAAADAYGYRTHGNEPDVMKISIPRSKINDYLHPENKNPITQSMKPRGEEGAQIFGIKQPIPKEYISRPDYNNLLLEVPHNVSEKMMPTGRLKIDPQLIEDMRKYLPDDSAYRDLIEAAHTGDFSKLFNLQSDVGKHSAKRVKDWFSSAQREKGRAGLDAVNALLSAMHKDMKLKGLTKESELLSQGRNDYRRHMKFKPYRNILGGAAATALGASLLPKNALSNLVEKVVSQYYK